MSYKFTLILFYKTAYKNNRLSFRPVQETDLPHIAHWIADMSGIPEEKEIFLRKPLQQEWDSTARISQQMSWMAVSNAKPLFLVEQGPDGEICLIGPSILFDHPGLSAATRQIIDDFLRLHLHQKINRNRNSSPSEE